nr:MAG TPA: hypothetical protein [Caudoviricetes sp.]
MRVLLDATRLSDSSPKTYQKFPCRPRSLHITGPVQRWPHTDF